MSSKRKELYCGDTLNTVGHEDRFSGHELTTITRPSPLPRRRQIRFGLKA